MAEQMRPASNKDAPDPSNSYERSHPEREAGMGKLHVPKPPRAATPGKMEKAGRHKQGATRQLNEEDIEHEPKHHYRSKGPIEPGTFPPPEPVDHSMNEE